MGVQKKTRKFAQVKRVIGTTTQSVFSPPTEAGADQNRPTRCPTVCNHVPQCPRRAAMLIPVYRKKNQMAGEVEAKKKEQENQAKREM
jgi:hypothetical protein